MAYSTDNSNLVFYDMLHVLNSNGLWGMGGVGEKSKIQCFLVSGKGPAVLKLVFKAHLHYITSVIKKSFWRYEFTSSRYNSWEGLPSVIMWK